MDTVLKYKRERKRRVARPGEQQGFESVGLILRRMLRETEAQVTSTFDPTLSLKLDLLDQEQRVEEAQQI